MSHPWICDTCGQPITQPKAGWVEWIQVNGGSDQWYARDMRLVHGAPESQCQFNQAKEYQKDHGTEAGRPLADFVGPNGLMNLLDRAADPAYKNIDITELIKRIQVPGYDLAKRCFDQAIQEGVIELNGPKGFYNQNQIEAVISHYAL